MKSILFIGEAGSGKTHALNEIIRILPPLLPPYTQLEIINDRHLFEDEVYQETARLQGNKRIGKHGTGYYDEQGNLTGFFVHDNEFNRRATKRLLSTMRGVLENPQRLIIAEIGVGINNSPQGSDPFRWTLIDRLETALQVGIPFSAVTDLIILETPYQLRFERQQTRPDKTPEEAFRNYSGEGGLPPNFQEILRCYDCRFTVIDNQGNNSELFKRQIVEAVFTLRPGLLEGLSHAPERWHSSGSKER